MKLDTNICNRNIFFIHLYPSSYILNTYYYEIFLYILYSLKWSSSFQYGVLGLVSIKYSCFSKELMRYFLLMEKHVHLYLKLIRTCIKSNTYYTLYFLCIIYTSLTFLNELLSFPFVPGIREAVYSIRVSLHPPPTPAYWQRSRQDRNSN